MSYLSRMLHTTREILNTRDERRVPPNPHQPPVFVRTNWLFVEIDEALAECAKLSGQIKVARITPDVREASRLNAELTRKLRQTSQLCAWAQEQFQREGA